MANKNATKEKVISTDKEFDFDELERQLQEELEEEFSDLEFLDEQQAQIGNPDALGQTILNIVWEQFTDQIAVQAGEDFIKSNNGLHLDLRDEAHIQTTENFAEGKIATHNTEIDYQERYDSWQSNFVKDENGKTTKAYRPQLGQRYYFCDTIVDICLTTEQLDPTTFGTDVNDTSFWLITILKLVFLPGAN